MIYLGPWRWQQDGFRMAFVPPVGANTLIDLRSLPDHEGGGDKQGGIFTSKEALGSDYYLLGDGDARDIKPDGKVLSAWDSIFGFIPAGNTLADLIVDHLCNGDPLGLDRCKPIAPTMNGDVELFVGGKAIRRDVFKWGDAYTNRLQSLLRADYDVMLAGSKNQNDLDQIRKCLDFSMQKYRVQDWRELVSPTVQAEIPGPLPHETTVTDDFNRADSSTIGNDSAGNAWSETNGDWNITSNQLTNTSIADDIDLRNGTNLSSADHSATADCVFASNTANTGTLSRFNAAARTYYRGEGDANSDTRIIFKVVAGSFTSLSSTGQTIGASTLSVMMRSNGSTQDVTVGASNSSITDTAITANVRTGIGGWGGFSVSVAKWDNFSAADLAASSAVKTRNGLAIASVKTINGLAIASVKTQNGLA